jgi:hypothetical protein
MGRTLHQTIIGQDAIKKTALGRYLHYQPCPEITLNPALAERCRQQHAIAIAGPATTLTLVDLANQLPIDITDQNELYLHPFARCEHLVCGDWTVITVPAAPEKQTLLEQVRGSRRGALALPTAISLIWVLIAALWLQPTTHQ